MTKSLCRVWGNGLARRLALTFSGAGLLLGGLWWSQTQMPDGAALMQRIGRGHDRVQSDGNGVTPLPPMLTKTRATAFPSIVIVRPDDAEAASMAQGFIDALTDASLYPLIQTALLRQDQDAAVCDETSTPLSNAPPMSDASSDRIAPPTLVYAIGARAMQSAIASARHVGSRTARHDGDADGVDATSRPLSLIFSDVDEVEAREWVPRAQGAGWTVGGVLAGPTLETQLQWARRYLPHAASGGIGYWTDSLVADASTPHEPNTANTANVVPPNTSRSSLRDRRVVGLLDAARGVGANDGGVDVVARADGTYREDADPDVKDAGAIEMVAASGRADDAIAQWRQRGVRLLFVDRETPMAVVQAAVAAGIATFCAADTVSRATMRGMCLLQVMPLLEAAPAMAAYQASHSIRVAPVVVEHQNGSQATRWQIPPHGPLQLDIVLARKTGHMPPLSLLDDVRIVDDAREVAHRQ
jgi:hypothetical protein